MLLPSQPAGLLQATIVAALAGELFAATTPATNTANIRLAAIMPFSYYENDGNSVNKTIRMAIDDINAQALIPDANFTVDLFDTAHQIGLVISEGFHVGLAGYNGVIGEDNSASSESLSYALASSKLFMCSGDSSDPALSDKTLFPNFFRICPSDDEQSLVMLSFLQSQSWSHAAILASNDNYGQGLANALQNAAMSYGVEILLRSDYDPTDDEGLAAKVSNTKLTGDDQQVPIVLIEAAKQNMIGDQFVWISDDAAYAVSGDGYPANVTKLFQGMFFTSPLEYTSTPIANKLVAAFEKRYGFYPEQEAGLYYDATWAMALALSNVMTKYGQTPDDIVSNRWLNLNLTIQEFTNFRWSRGGGADEKRSTLMLTPTSLFLAVFLGYRVQYRIPPSDLPVLLDDTLGFHQPAVAAIVVLAALVTVVITATLPILFLLRDDRTLHLLSTPFMATSAVGMLMLLIAIFIDSSHTPTAGTCNAYMAFTCLGFGIVVGSILGEGEMEGERQNGKEGVETNRIYRLYENHRALSRPLRPAHLFTGLGATLVGEFIILIVWIAGFSLEPVSYQDLVSDSFYYQCHSTDSTAESALTAGLFGYNAILLLLCCFFSLKTRNVASEFHEAKAIGIAVYNIAICVIIACIMTYLTSSTMVVHFVVKSLMAMIAITVTWAMTTGRFVIIAVMRMRDGSLERSAGGGSAASDSMPKIGISAKRVGPQLSIVRAPQTSAGIAKFIRAAVRGASPATSNSQWRSFTVVLIAQPLNCVLLMGQDTSFRSLVIPALSIAASKEGGKGRLTIAWGKGKISIQLGSEREVDEWLEIFETIKKGGEQSSTGFEDAI
ncbi:periplasmic binding protein-like I [Blyttiomyces helicus]|uniref:Periplasmic binding protein-like I n=1 Tax=Blyttiomyces helicus TaxID=388810 RepID=A0A4V1IS81_9FUNG|nr:periplasmic binding protein-like I [Blyttiomyces helicus]|eukprot:RKO92637.1 periplasmic binding protein-like I [Blyttiomyces helicus]